jgi:glycosyltransferase involved in cell wall biosynthesis
MRVLMTVDTVGGVWTYGLDLARHLRPLGIDCTLAITGPCGAAHREQAARSGVAVRDTGLGLDWLAPSSREVLQAGAAIADLARRESADVVHLNAPALAACREIDAPVVAACHSCLATWWRAVHRAALPAELAWHCSLLVRAYAEAQVLVAPTAAFSDATRRCYDLARAPYVVPNGRSTAGQPSLPMQDEVFVAGRLWDAGKNVAVLDRAAARLPFPVRAAGPLQGPDGSSITLRHAQALGVLRAEEVARHLAARPVFASLPFYEPFGLAVLEAAQAGCALILSDIPSLRELWQDAAVFVDPHQEPGALIRRVVQDRAWRARLGRAAARRAARYSAEAMAAGMAAVYGSMVAKQERAA